MFVTVLLFENEFDALDGILKWNNKEIKNIDRVERNERGERNGL